MEETTRQKKFARLIQKEVAEILLKDTKGIVGNSFVSVSYVSISPDLALAKIYLSMLLEKDSEAILEKIEFRKKEIRKMLGNKIGKQVRIIPELIFMVDDLEEKAFKMDALIDSLEIPPPADESARDSEEE
jgi:ribosome-binding factor A